MCLNLLSDMLNVVMLNVMAQSFQMSVGCDNIRQHSHLLALCLAPLGCDVRKSIVIQNKSNTLHKIFWSSHKNYNYLQITQIGNYLQKLLKDMRIVRLGFG